jgi:hypothetical protein
MQFRKPPPMACSGAMCELARVAGAAVRLSLKGNLRGVVRRGVCVVCWWRGMQVAGDGLVPSWLALASKGQAGLLVTGPHF